MRQCGARDSGHPDDVDIEDTSPLLIIVVGDGALGSDSRIVDYDVDSTEFLDDRGDSRSNGRVVSDIRFDREKRWIRFLRLKIEYRD